MKKIAILICMILVLLIILGTSQVVFAVEDVVNIDSRSK